MRFRLVFAAVVTAAPPVVAQQRTMTNADYARAEHYMSYNTAPLVAGGAVRPTWLAGDRFVYRVAAADSSGDVMTVDPVRGTRARLLDDVKLAAAVATALSSTADAIRQPSTKNRLSADGRMIVVSLAGRSVSCDVSTMQGARLRQRIELHDAPPPGLFREESLGSRTAEELRARPQAGGARQTLKLPS